MMRILYIYNINQIAQTYGEDLTRYGHSVEIYNPSLEGANASLPIKLAKIPKRILNERHIVGQLKPRYYDLVHIHWASYGVLGLISQIPFVVECHGSDVRYRLNQPFFRSILAPIFRRAAAVLCITPDILPVVQSIRPDALFFPGPIDTEQFVQKMDEKTGPWTILLFARLDPNKGTDIAVKGIARFTQRHPEVCVRLLDWGPEKEKYKKHYGDRFEFITRVAPNLVQYLIRSADVVVGQLLSGALGLSELQAMSCAKPVIASFHYEDAYPVLPPLCQASTAEEVDKQLEHLFRYPDAALELGQRARKWITTFHERQALAMKLEMLYFSILNKQSGGETLDDLSKN